MEDKKEYRYQVILSTDGKLTVMGGADKVDEIKQIYDKLLPTFKEMIAVMKENDLQKKAGGFPKKEKEWTGDKCPKDGGRLYHIVTKTGKDMCKCENSTFINGVAGGCDFVAWGKNLKDAAEQKAAWKAAKARTDMTVEEFENGDPPF